MYNPSITTTPGFSSSNIEFSGEAAIWILVSFILAIVGAFVVYFWFVKSDKKYDNKFLMWLKSFLDFQSMLIEVILKIAYIFTALFITLSSFSVIGESFIGFLFVLIGGNIIARVVYESGMLLLGIWKNTTDINKKLK